MTTPTIHIPINPADQVPNSDNSVSLGTALKRWQNTFSVKFIGEEFLPKTDDTYNLGSGSFRFKDIYATNAIVQTSDIRRKQDVAKCSLGLDFVNSVDAIDFKVLGGKRVHMGFPAQGLEKAFQEQGLDRAAIVVDKAGWYGIRYEELIAPLWTATQQLDVKVNDALDLQSETYYEIMRERLNRKQAIEELRVSISEIEQMKRELQIVETIKEVVVEVPVIREVIKEVVVQVPIIQEVVVTKHRHINRIEIAILVALVLNFIATVVK
jgi:hypothetical protein